MKSMLNYLEELKQDTDKNEAEIVTMAIETGLRQLWKEKILGRYLKKEITRDEAIELVGIDLVELTEKQYDAMKEDVEWALNL
ncbi:MAG: hypothetical protein C4527_25330 [Candidatus Omnitrophota bacterium]|jgi:hypothetical protein|nr:MAG: hypothetical protein C4527_25330 [Candidatus Omnitrophota bacterium]